MSQENGASCQRLARLSRSNVRSADAFATASRPDPGRERASRRSSATQIAAAVAAVRGLLVRSLFAVLYSDPPGVLSVAPRATATVPPGAWPPLDLASPGV
jgi:hypothetical protein